LTNSTAEDAKGAEESKKNKNLTTDELIRTDQFI